MMSESGKVHMRYGLSNRHEYIMCSSVVCNSTGPGFLLLDELIWDLNRILRPCDTDEKKQIQQSANATHMRRSKDTSPIGG
jgi:hypothetical protein